MRTLIAATLIGSVLLAGAFLYRRRSVPPPATDGTVSLRQAVLTREMLKDARAEASDSIIAVVFDWHVGDGVATLVAFEDGTTSIYLSSGGGIIGAGAHERVRQAAASFRETAARALDQFAPTTDYEMPGPGYATFYVVTGAATHSSGRIATAELQESGHPLGPLAQQAQAVFTAVREAS